MIDEFNSVYNPESNTIDDSNLEWVNDFIYRDGGIIKA
jgi:hypothetical protein